MRRRPRKILLPRAAERPTIWRKPRALRQRDPVVRLIDAIVARDAASVDRLATARTVSGGVDVGEVLRVTPLMYACAAGDLGIVRLLLDRGADPRAVDVHLNGDERVENWRGASCLHCLFARRAPAADDDDDAHPTLAAAMAGGTRERGPRRPVDPRILELLLKRGADPDAVTGAGTTVLDACIEGGDIELLPRLLRAGDNPNVIVSGGYGPMSAAISTGSVEAVRLLLEHGYDATILGHQGTILDVAAVEGFAGALPLLVAHGADPYAPDERGRTCLFGAIASGDETAVEWLCRRHPRLVHLADDDGVTPQSWAQQLGVKAIVATLRRSTSAAGTRRGRGAGASTARGAPRRSARAPGRSASRRRGR